MVTRRTIILDAALEIVGRRGMRGLTHRAVDAAARLPTGSTSNVFRTREALLLGIADHFVTRERGMAEGERGEVETTPAGIAAAFGAYARRATGPDRVVTLARYALLVEAGQHPELADALAPVADRVDTWALDLVTRAGSPDPARDLGIVANYVTGLVLHQLALPTPDFEPERRLAAVIDTLGWSPA